MQTQKIAKFECEYCGFNAPIDKFDCQYGEHYCPECGDERVKYTGEERDAEWYSVAVYSVDREYGGPEEGGWYYDTFRVLPETLRCFGVAYMAEAKAYHAQLCENYRDDREFAVRYFAEKIVMKSPETRPFYC